MYKRLLILLVISLSSFSINAFHTKNVVIIIIDGARYSETFGDTNHTNIPHLWNDLRPSGMIYTSYYNDSITLTVSGHATTISGVWNSLANDGTERIHLPTIFEYYRKENEAGETSCAIIAGKNKLQILSYSDHAEYGPSYSASVAIAPVLLSDTSVISAAKQFMTDNHPVLTLINLPEVDNAGHSGDYNAYLSAIHSVDSLVYEMWVFLQRDTIYKNTTTLILTNDHGRHTADFINHGDLCDGCRHLMLMITGPDTPAGSIDSSYHNQQEIAPTIGHLIGFQSPLAKGKIIMSAITNTGVKKYESFDHLSRKLMQCKTVNPVIDLTGKRIAGSKVGQGLQSNPAGIFLYKENKIILIR